MIIMYIALAVAALGIVEKRRLCEEMRGNVLYYNNYRFNNYNDCRYENGFRRFGENCYNDRHCHHGEIQNFEESRKYYEARF